MTLLDIQLRQRIEHVIDWEERAGRARRDPRATRGQKRWPRFAHAELTAMFPYLPRQPGCIKRLWATLHFHTEQEDLSAAASPSGRRYKIN